MIDPSTNPAKQEQKQQPRWRVYAAIGAILAAVVTVTNGVNAISKFPASVSELSHWLWPGPESPPVSLTIATDTTKPPPGYSIVNVADVGDVFGGGADVRLVMQAQSPDLISQVVRLTARVKRVEVGTEVAFNADQLVQPGSGSAGPETLPVDDETETRGTARPETFLVNVESETSGTVAYMRDQQTYDEAPFPEILPREPPLVFQFGGADGAQETIDLKLRLKSPGIYEVRFAATIISDNKEYVVETAPLRMGQN